jgi:tRNA threonylcarbamoyladenosine biosynthesis protein TsaB
MKLLCIDTATFFESVALLDGDRIVAEHRVERHRGHGPGILDDVDRLLSTCGWTLHDVDGFISGLGPGSFTGLRISLATLKGFALAHDKPIYGARTTQVVRAGVGDDAVAILDARRGQVYVEGGDLTAPVCCDPKAVSSLLGDKAYQLVGDGAVLYRETLTSSMPRARVVDDSDLHHPRAALLVGLVDLETPQALATLEPIYVRKSDAEINYPDGFPDAALRLPGSK